MTLTVKNLCIVGSFLLVLSCAFLFTSIFGFFFKLPPTQRYIFIVESWPTNTKFSIYDTTLKNYRLHHVKNPSTYNCPVNLFGNIQEPSVTAHILKICLKDMLSKISFIQFHNHDMHYYLNDEIYQFCFNNGDICKDLFNQIRGSFYSIGVIVNGDDFQYIEDDEKAVFQWVSENLKLGNFNGNNEESVMTMFLGDTTNSIVMEKGNILDDENIHKINIFSENYDVVQLKYSCFGLNETRLSYIYREILRNTASNRIKISCFPSFTERNFSSRDLWTKCRQPPTTGDIFKKEYILHGSGDYGSCLRSINEILDFKINNKNMPVFPSYQKYLLSSKNISVVGGLLKKYSQLGIKPNSSLKEFMEAYKELCFKNISANQLPINFCFDMIYTGEFLDKVAKDMRKIEYPSVVYDVPYEDGMATVLSSGIQFLATQTIFKVVGLLSFLLSTFIFFLIGIYMLFRTTQVKKRKKSINDPSY